MLFELFVLLLDEEYVHDVTADFLYKLNKKSCNANNMIIVIVAINVIIVGINNTFVMEFNFVADEVTILINIYYSF